ncbi:MAG: hypothetical protein QM817_36730 [Archangium sp.]
MMRRGVLGVAAFGAVLLVAFVAATVRTNRALGERLVKDVVTLTTHREKLPRPDGAPAAHRVNGLGCFANSLRLAPATVTRTLDDDLGLEPFASGVHPLSQLPESSRMGFFALAPWLEGVLSCADASEVQVPDELAPWNDANVWLPVARLAMRHAALDVRMRLSQSETALALEVCTQAVEFEAMLSHLGAPGVAASEQGLRLLVPLCIESWNKASLRERDHVAARWLLLDGWLASDERVIDSERIGLSLMLFRSLASSRSREQLPIHYLGSEPSSLRERLLLMRVWAPLDAKLRRVASRTPGPELPWWADDVLTVDPADVLVRTAGLHAQLGTLRELTSQR